MIPQEVFLKTGRRGEIHFISPSVAYPPPPTPKHVSLFMLFKVKKKKGTQNQLTCFEK